MLWIFKPIIQLEFLALRTLAWKEKLHPTVIRDDWGYLIKQFCETLLLEPSEGVKLNFNQTRQLKGIWDSRVPLLT